MPDPPFRGDLYRGTAPYYDRYRVPYPRPLIKHLSERAGSTPQGTLLDLGCGTGQLALALRESFAEVWAVDSEPEMIAAVREKAGGIRALTAAVEELTLPADSFDLVTIGNAFHRMNRDAVAARVLRWLRPGGYLALVWGGDPWDGALPWQRALAEVTRR